MTPAFLEIMHGYGLALFFCLKIVGVFLVLHILTISVAILTSKIEKDAEGNLVLDPNCWHFKAAYPLRRYNNNFLEELKKNGLNICPYFLDLTFMLWLGWPFLIIVEGLRTIIGNVIVFNSGFYHVPSLKQLVASDGPEDLNLYRFQLPTIKGFVIRPIYILVSLAYVLWLWINYRATMSYTIMIMREALNVVLKLVAPLVVAILLAILIRKKVFKKSENKKVYLAKEFLSAKYKRFCRKMVLKNS